MKQIAVVFRVFLLATVLVSLAACSGGTFVDPGHEAAVGGGGEGSGGGGGGNGGGGGSKPAKLSSSASYAQAADKLDEIIDYCNSHPGMVNDTTKNGAQALKATISVFQSNWNTRGPEMVNQINTFIDMLE
jgi:hypothetical protein